MGIVVPPGDIVRAIARLADIDDQRVSLTTRLDELVSDSFVLVQLAIDIQDEFDVVFYAEDLGAVQDVADLVELVRSRL